MMREAQAILGFFVDSCLSICLPCDFINHIPSKADPHEYTDASSTYRVVAYLHAHYGSQNRNPDDPIDLDYSHPFTEFHRNLHANALAILADHAAGRLLDLGQLSRSCA